jgi:RNA polymerase sigma factor (sigma-70 family)
LLLFRKIHTFRGESAFSTWLHRLVINRVLMHLRKKSLPVVSMETGSAPDGEATQPSVKIAASDLLLEGSIDRINLGRCVAQLPAGSRAIFVLHDIQGYQHSEIAEMLGRSVGASKSQLHKARKRLRELLHEIQREKYRGERLAAQKTLCDGGAEFDPDGEEKRPIGTCAEQRKTFMPILQSQLFFGDPSHRQKSCRCVSV